MDGLDLRIRRELRPVTNAELAECASWAKANKRAAELSGICDKALAVEIGMDTAQLSKTLNGQLGVMPEKLFALMDACGSEFPLMWLNYQRGYDIEAMRQRETELQRQLRESQERAEKAERERDLLVRMFQGKAAA